MEINTRPVVTFALCFPVVGLGSLARSVHPWMGPRWILHHSYSYSCLFCRPPNVRHALCQFSYKDGNPMFKANIQLHTSQFLNFGSTKS